jgi:hypothetical protein
MSHAGKADDLLIKPTAGARPASPCALGRFIRKARTRGLTPDESTNDTDDTGWQRPLTNRLIESHRRQSRDRQPRRQGPAVGTWNHRCLAAAQVVSADRPAKHGVRAPPS